MHPLWIISLKSIDKTHTKYASVLMGNDTSYYIMEVCNCSNEIEIKVFIYFYDLSS